MSVACSRSRRGSCGRCRVPQGAQPTGGGSDRRRGLRGDRQIGRAHLPLGTPTDLAVASVGPRDAISCRRDKNVGNKFGARPMTVNMKSRDGVKGFSLVLLAAGLLVSGCRGRKGQEQGSSATGRNADGAAELVVAVSRADAASRVTTGSSDQHTDAGPGAEITAPCVLHAGDSDRHRREALGPKGKPGAVTSKADCSFNAERIGSKGRLRRVTATSRSSAPSAGVSVRSPSFRGRGAAHCIHVRPGNALLYDRRGAAVTSRALHEGHEGRSALSVRVIGSKGAW